MQQYCPGADTGKCDRGERHRSCQRAGGSDILCSTLTRTAWAAARTIKEGGAVYDFISGLQVGIADMADSLAAIKTLVFEEKKITAGQLMDALENDFAGPEGERIRRLLINEAPKYGNDDDRADLLVVDAYASTSMR